MKVIAQRDTPVKLPVTAFLIELTPAEAKVLVDAYPTDSNIKWEASKLLWPIIVRLREELA